MKLSLVFLVCFIGASMQRSNFAYNRQSRRVAPYLVLVNPEPVDYDFTDDDDQAEDSVDQRMAEHLSRLKGSNFPSLQQYHHNENVNQYYGSSHNVVPSYPLADESISSRQKNRMRPLGNIFRGRPAAVPSSPRLFFGGGGFQNLFFPSALFSLLSGYSSSIYSTTTTFMVVNSTLTTTLVTSCIPLAQFTVVNQVTSTNPCRRKRSDDLILVGNDDQFFHQQFAEEDDSIIDLEASMMRGSRLNDIESSKELLESSNDVQRFPSLNRYGRSARYTVTSTFTSYSFATVNSTRTVQIYSQAPGNPGSLTCVPGGYKVC